MTMVNNDKKFNGIQPYHLKNVSKNGNINQQKNLIRLLTKVRFNTGINYFIQGTI